MCGFVGVFEIGRNGENLRAQVLRMSGKIRHRGPDWSGIYCGPRAVLSHERLSIVDPQSGGQPLYSPDGRLVLAVNGEIYNHRELRRELAGEYDFRTGSDCEVILPLYRKYGAGLLDRLNGIFAFALYDIERDEYLIARDPVGVIPLYIGWDADERCYVASELKALEGVCNVIRPFEPGYYRWSREGKTTRWYTRDWFDYEAVEQGDADPAALRSALEAAVRRQLMSDVPYGVLLSGGLDSSIISAVAKRFADRRIETEGRDGAWWPCLHSFAVGLKGAPDLRAARKVADHIGTVHHEIHYTVQEGLDALRDAIYHIETYDVTTVRASTPMYLLARVIKSMGVKMVLSGEGADEIFGGYLYFHKAPDARAFHEETVRKIGRLHHYDCLRANKSLAAWGIEGRVPFLDTEFLDTAMRIAPEAKRPATDASKSGFCARRSKTSCRRRSSGGRRSSSPTAWATAGSTRSKHSRRPRSPTAKWRRRPTAFRSTRRRTRRSTTTARSSRSVSLADGRAVRAVGAFGGVQHGRGAGVGRIVPQSRRSVGTRRAGCPPHRPGRMTTGRTENSEYLRLLRQ